MRFSSSLMICLLLYHRIIFSECSILREKILTEGEDILKRFFAETKLHLDEANTRHVTVVGASDDQLHQAKSLLGTFPHFVGRDAKEFCKSREFAPRSFIIYFLSSMEEEYITKVLESLFRCKRNLTYFIFGGISVTNVDIELVLRLAFEKSSKRPIFIHHTAKSLKLYGYEISPDCSRRAGLLVDWMPGVNTKWIKDLHDDLGYKACPLPVGAVHQPPWMSLAEDSNGTVRIIGGSEGEIISTIAQKMNFTPLVQAFEFSGSDRNPKTAGMISSCAARNTAIGIAHIRPTKGIYEVVDLSSGYTEECIVWAIPRIGHWKLNIMTSEFSWSTWLLIGLAFLVSFGVERIIRNTNHPNRGNANDSDCCSIIFDLIGLTLGNPIVYRPLTIGSKFLLIIYLCYSTVITTGYKSSLSSILTVDEGVPDIVGSAGLIAANITPGGDGHRLGVLKDQMGDDEVVSELTKRFVIERNISKALLQVSRDKNFAYLVPITQLAYHADSLRKAGERISFYMPDRCELSYRVVMVSLESSYLTHRIDQIIQRLVASGLIEYWNEKNVLQQHRLNFRSAQSQESRNNQEQLLTFNRQKFYYVLRLHCIALTLCFLVFLGELIVHKFQIAGGGKRLKNLKRLKIGRRVPL